VFSGKVIPFWSILGTVLAVYLIEAYPFKTWQAVKAYFFSTPFFYHSCALYLLSLVLALFTYRNLYNLKVLLAGFLFLMTGMFSLYYYFDFLPAIFNACHVQKGDRTQFLLYLLYSWNLAVITFVPAHLPKTVSRIILSLFISLEVLLLWLGPRYLLPVMDRYLVWKEHSALLALSSLNGVIMLSVQLLSIKRQDVYAWPISGFAILFTLAYASRGSDLEVLLLLLVPIALVFMVMSNLMLSLSHRANYDPLLNIYNRGYGNSLLQGNIRSLSRGYSVAIFDLDHFKQLNDRYGHQAGDHVLYTVAQKLREKALPHGITCRYGGEEFMVVFPNLIFPQAKKATQEMVAAIFQMQIYVKGKRSKKPTKIKVTISGGLASAAGKDSRAVLEAADKALYRAKRAGRNRVCVARQ